MPPSSNTSPPTPVHRLLRAATIAGAVLVLALVGYLILQLLIRLAPLTMAVIAGLLLAALTAPISRDCGACISRHR